MIGNEWVMLGYGSNNYRLGKAGTVFEYHTYDIAGNLNRISISMVQVHQNIADTTTTG